MYNSVFCIGSYYMTRSHSTDPTGDVLRYCIVH